MIIIGHRGACGYEDENTLNSFQKAIDLGIHYVEFDVYKCKTGELIVHHDIILDNLTNLRGFIEEKTFEEISHAKTKHNLHLPTLQEVLDLIDKRVNVNIEIKSENSSKDVIGVINHYISEKNWELDNFIISSFFHEELLKFSKLNSNIKIGVLIGHLPINSDFLDEFDPYCVSLDEEFISLKFVKEVKKKGIKIFAYTVNSKKEFTRLRKLGVDGVFSNFPNKII